MGGGANEVYYGKYGNAYTAFIHVANIYANLLEQKKALA